MPHERMSPGEHEELRRQVEEFISNGHIRKIMSTCAQPHGPRDLMSLHVSGSVPNKVHDFVEGLPYHGDSSDDDLVGNSRTNFVYPWGNDEGPSIKERALLFLEAQDRTKQIQLFIFYITSYIKKAIKMLDFKPGGSNSITQVVSYCNGFCSYYNPATKPFSHKIPNMDDFLNVDLQIHKGRAYTIFHGGMDDPILDVRFPQHKEAVISEFTINGGEKLDVQIEGIVFGVWTILYQKHSTNLAVGGGWDMEYHTKFVPDANPNLAIAVKKPGKMKSESILWHDSYTAKEVGKFVTIFDNTTNKNREVIAHPYIVQHLTLGRLRETKKLVQKSMFRVA
nr:hypothetical protein [Tanacetum cinerariifolium]